MTRPKGHLDGLDKVLTSVGQGCALSVGSGQLLNPGDIAFRYFLKNCGQFDASNAFLIAKAAPNPAAQIMPRLCSPAGSLCQTCGVACLAETGVYASHTIQKSDLSTSAPNPICQPSPVGRGCPSGDGRVRGRLLL
jgi:hypothetical protein